MITRLITNQGTEIPLGAVVAATRNKGGVENFGEPPAPSSGQTLVWRMNDSQASTLTVDAAGDLNLTYYTGTDSYLRPGGPRFGPATNPSWKYIGNSLRVPYNSASVRLNARVDLSAQTAYKTLGMYGAWFKFSLMGSAFKRILGMRGSGTATTGAPETWATIRWDGTDVILAKTDSAGGTNTNATVICKLHQWVWISICHQWTGSAYKWRLYYKTVGGSMTQIGTESSYGGDRRGPLYCLQNTNDGSLDDVTTGGSWVGSVGAFSAYSLDAMATGAVYPADIEEPSDNDGYAWKVSASASGTGDGYRSAWTEAQLRAELAYGTIRGSYKGLRDASNNIYERPTTVTAADTFAVNAEAGNIFPCGDSITFTGTIEQHADYGCETMPGIYFKGTGTLTTERTLTGTFTQPNAGTYPNVWQLLDTVFVHSRSGVDGYTGATVIIDGYRYTPQGGATLASVLSALNTTAKTSYADAAGIYFHSTTNPNTNGLTKKYIHPLQTSPSQSTTGAQLILSIGMVAPTLTIVGGPMYAHQASSPDYVAGYCVGVVHTTDQRAIVEGVLRGGSKHNLCLTGTGTVGALVVGCEFQAGSGISYTAYTTSGSAATIFTRAMSTMIETSYHLIGGVESSTPTDTYQSIYTHNNGVTVGQFSTFANDVIHGEGDVFLGVANITPSLELSYPAPTIVSVTTSTNGVYLYITTSKELAGNAGFTLNVDAVANALTHISTVGTLMTYELADPELVYFYSTLTLDYTAGDVEGALSEVALANFSGMAVTNGVPFTATYDGGLLVFEPPYPFAGHSGFSVEVNGNPVTLTYWSGDPSEGSAPDYIGPNFTLDTPAVSGDVITLFYTPGDVVNALNSNPLGAFTDFPVINNAV